MRFLLVDRILTLEMGKTASGIKNVAFDGDFLEETFPGIPVFSPVIAAEAAAQLVSWLIAATSDFTVKPLVTMVDTYTCTKHVQPGDRIELEGVIESLHPESALIHARVLHHGKPVIELQHAVGYLFPLGELENPANSRRQFEQLYTQGESLPAQIMNAAAGRLREEIPLNQRAWVDRIVDYQESQSIVGIRNVTATEDCFNDHFSLKPILPGVLIMESLISLAKILIARILAVNGLDLRKPILAYCHKIKLRKFVQPGDQMVMNAKVDSFHEDKSSVRVKAAVENKTVASIEVGFEHLDRQQYLKSYLS